jgi:hypothetical protein
VIYADTSELWVDIPYTTCTTNSLSVTTCIASSDVTIYFSQTYNPSFFTANAVTSTWEVYTMNSSYEKIDGLSTGIIATPDLLGQSVLVLDV